MSLFIFLVAPWVLPYLCDDVGYGIRLEILVYARPPRPWVRYHHYTHRELGCHLLLQTEATIDRYASTWGDVWPMLSEVYDHRAPAVDRTQRANGWLGGGAEEVVVQRSKT